MSELDANVIVNGQKAIATVAQTGTVIEDGGAIDATSVIQTESGPQKVVKTYDLNGGGGGGGEQNIKAYHAPSATLDATLGVIIPNVDACTEQGLYNVDYSFESDGATITSNALLEVSETSMSGVSAIAQNLLINVGTELVYCTRNYISNTFTSWEGKNIPTELQKYLKNEATGTKSVCILTDTSYNSANYSLAIGNFSRSYNYAVSLGCASKCSADMGVAVGNQAQSAGYGATALGANSAASGKYSIGLGSYSGGAGEKSVTIGYFASSNAQEAIQLGEGSNSVAKQFQVYTYPMLDGNTGKIPNARINGAIVVDSYDDGNGNGWRLWSDNWCEQYGVYDNQAKSNDFYTTVNFTKTFANAFYFSTAQAFNLNETEAFRDGSTDIYAKTTSSMSFGFYRSGSGDGYRYISWKCEGYIQTES